MEKYFHFTPLHVVRYPLYYRLRHGLLLLILLYYSVERESSEIALYFSTSNPYKGSAAANLPPFSIGAKKCLVYVKNGGRLELGSYSEQWSGA